MTNNELRFIQDQIGYDFRNPDLLEQAFTRRSYTEENGGENNEVLEFIGDKVLDFAVVKILSQRFGHFERAEQDPRYWNKRIYSGHFQSEKSEGELSSLKAQLVNKTMLSHRIDELGIAEYLRMGKGDIANGVGNQPSVKEDLFEAILGAVALDCDWDLETLQGVVEVMLDPDSSLETEEFNYVSFIQRWVNENCNDIPLYRFEQRGYQSSCYIGFQGIKQNFSLDDPKQKEVKWWCYLKVADDIQPFLGFGKNQSEARKAVCELAYNYLDKQGLLPTIRDEIENPNLADAIGQLEIIARRGYFSLPTYEFREEHDQNGNPIWTCECHIAEKEYFFDAQSSSKKEAKKKAAYEMLQDVLKED